MAGCPPALRAAATLLGPLLWAVGCRGAALACSSETEVSGGSSYKWPQENPALVAPVTTHFAYQKYTSPVTAEFTGTELMIKAPLDMAGGFNIVNATTGHTIEKYILTSIQFRIPGKVPEGTSQVVGHAVEACLIHKEATGTGYWANVVVPFEVSPVTSTEFDFLSVIVGVSELPSQPGETQTLLLGSGGKLDLNSVWKDTSFLTFWADLPTNCPGETAYARQFMREKTILTTREAMSTTLKALESSHWSIPWQPPEVAWKVSGCPMGNGTCPVTEAKDLEPELQEALQLQSDAVKNLRQQKNVMDDALVALQEEQDGAYENAVVARQDLRNAQFELEGAVNTVAKLTAAKDAAAAAQWDSFKPAPLGAAASDAEVGAAAATEQGSQVQVGSSQAAEGAAPGAGGAGAGGKAEGGNAAAAAHPLGGDWAAEEGEITPFVESAAPAESSQAQANVQPAHGGGPAAGQRGSAARGLAFLALARPARPAAAADAAGTVAERSR